MTKDSGLTVINLRQIEFAISGMDNEFQRQTRHWKDLDDNLQNLGDVIKDALSDPERSHSDIQWWELIQDIFVIQLIQL